MLNEQTTKPMDLDIKFDPQTATFYYPDGVTETLGQYQKRIERFRYIQNLQGALEKLKVLYQNPGCLNEKDYLKAKDVIQEEFEVWEANIFVEYEDAWPGDRWEETENPFAEEWTPDSTDDKVKPINIRENPWTLDGWLHPEEGWLWFSPDGTTWTKESEPEKLPMFLGGYMLPHWAIPTIN